MKRLAYLSLALLVAASCLGGESRFKAADGCFTLDGKPFIVKAAELHYPRIPRAYWDHRIKMSKALGMNTVCLYVFWNIHEQRPGEFDFTGQNDLREFIRLCDANGMKVIVRPGPYVCAEWEMGGMPWWLLRKKEIRLRECDPWFLERTGLFFAKVAEQIGDLTADRGGPVIMMQVENEYGSYGTDKEYVGRIRDMLRKEFGSDITLFQCDWSSNFLNNGLDDLLWTINFGTGADIDAQFAPLRKARPGSPLMCSEFWSGWFDKWGARHETRQGDEMVAGIGDMLSRGISFSLYMTHGGTSWGHWAGANSPGYAPDVTSYDYDAPISESGQPTAKYHALREMLARYNGGEELPPVPASPEAAATGEIRFSEVAPLADNLPRARRDSVIRPMEEYGQGFGTIIYRTELPAVDSLATLTVNEPHDYARIFIDGRHVGDLDRRLGEKELQIGRCRSGAVLEILVEAMGRINFGRAVLDRKGITDSVTLTMHGSAPATLGDWQVCNIEDEYPTYTAMSYRHLDASVRDAGGRLPAGAYRAVFSVDRPADTFLDLESWGKGLVYVNGHPLGRFWEIGPQQTLYLPGCWLKEGDNELIVFDIIGPREALSRGLKEPELDGLRDYGDASGAQRVKPDLSGERPLIDGSFPTGGGVHEVVAKEPAKGRYVCLEVLDAADGSDCAAMAELWLLDDGGNRLPREKWKAVGADSEEKEGNHTADKLFDLQESTCWLTATGAAYPHTVVIDLGEVVTVGGIQSLPRMEPGAPGAVGRFRLYVSETPFAAAQQ